MTTAGIFPIVLVLAAFLCSLVAGFLFAFSVVVMPGIGSLNSGEFIRAFQVMDRVIQNNQPIFMLVWVGSVMSLVTSAVLGIGQLDGVGRILIICAAVAFLLCVQIPTIVINIPLNNKLQALNVNAIDETEQSIIRKHFESRWKLWNSIRTAFASLASLLLIILLFRL